MFHHAEPFTWTQDVLVDPDAKPGNYELTVTPENIMICDNNSCTPLLRVHRPLYAPVEILDGEAVTPDKTIVARLQKPAGPTVVTPTKEQEEEARKHGQTIKPPGDKGVDPNNLLSFLGFASISAFLMLLTPCVFPMIPITVNFFIKQSEKRASQSPSDGHRLRRHHHRPADDDHAGAGQRRDRPRPTTPGLTPFSASP